MIAVDTNLLVYAHREETPLHERAKAAIEAAASDPRGWGIALPCIAEFWSIVTHPQAPGRPSTPDEATEFLEVLRLDAGATVWVPGPGFEQRLARVASGLRVTGVRIFDLQIALTVVEAGASEIWTHDANFVVVPGLRVVDPLS